MAKKKKKKSTTIVLRIGKPKKKQYDAIVMGVIIRKAFKKQVRALKKHFKEDGWDLDSNSAFQDALYDVFGSHLHDLFLAEVVGSGVAYWTVTHKDTKPYMVYRKEKKKRNRVKK